MLTAIIYILLICGLAALVIWALGELGTPAPLANVVRVLTICIAILLVVMVALNLLGLGPGLPPLLK
jgi:hypothetical protein